MQEPVINIGCMSDEEFYGWMDQKIMALKRLRELQSHKASLEEQLTRIEGQIEEATVQSRVDITRLNKRPTPLHCCGVDRVYHETMVKALRLEIEELKGTTSQDVAIINQASNG